MPQVCVATIAFGEAPFETLRSNKPRSSAQVHAPSCPASSCLQAPALLGHPSMVLIMCLMLTHASWMQEWALTSLMYALLYTTACPPAWRLVLTCCMHPQHAKFCSKEGLPACCFFVHHNHGHQSHPAFLSADDGLHQLRAWACKLQQHS